MDNLYQFKYIRVCGNVCYDPVSHGAVGATPKQAALSIYDRHYKAKNTTYSWKSFVLEIKSGGKLVGRLVLHQTPVPEGSDDMPQFIDKKPILKTRTHPKVDDLVEEKASVSDPIDSLEGVTIIETSISSGFSSEES